MNCFNTNAYPEHNIQKGQTGACWWECTKVTSVFPHRIPFPALFVSTAEKVTFRVSLDPAIHHKPATLYGMGLSQRSPCILLSASLLPAFLRVWGL